MTLRALLTAALLLLAGCGVAPEDRPEELTVPAAPSTATDTTADADGSRLTVFFVRGARLSPVQRPAATLTATAALDLLRAGPSRAEVAAGVRTALPPQRLTLADGPGDVLTVAVDRDFTGLTGGNQLLAVAQVVWTLTGVSSSAEVLFVVDGTTVEVPTDAGLTDEPVDREDYRSIAPENVLPTSAAPSGSDPEASRSAPATTPTG